MKTIEYFSKTWTVKFDTDPAPKKSREKRGMTCTLTATDGEVVIARAECSNKDTFSRETGEALSLKRALESISSKMVKIQIRNAFAMLKSNTPDSKMAVSSVPAIVGGNTETKTPTKKPVKKAPVKKSVATPK